MHHLLREIEELKKEIEILKRGKNALRYTNQQLFDENEKYTKALLFYGNEKNYVPIVTSAISISVSDIDVDKGKYAREVFILDKNVVEVVKKEDIE